MAHHPIRGLVLASFLSSMIEAPAFGQSLDLSKSTIVDLTHSFDAKTIYWPTSPSGFELKSLHNGLTERGYFYAANSFCSPEHGGTHLDAPLHFARGHWTNAEIPVDRFVGPAFVIDVSAKAAADPDYTLTPEDIAEWEAAHGRIPPSAIVLLRTGWSARWSDRKSYLGDDTPGDATHLHFPGYGAQAAALLVVDRRAKLIGIDTASVDNGPSQDFLVHRIVAGADAAGLENLDNLDKLPATGAIVFALPMKISGGTGGPARIVAMVAR
ncbi:cyclase family protein [Methylosinus sp. RM1]|uniref:cyclase family protein n=1 Tax=Methylosinus sp. RM1 TaxID=2583817 RepID=UPI00140DA498|nr:cyclase family protein [Methylosinus sp. RM1]